MCVVAKALRPIAQIVERIQKVSLEAIGARSVVAGARFDAKAGAGEEGILELLKCNKGVLQKNNETAEPPQSCWSMAEA